MEAAMTRPSGAKRVAKALLHTWRMTNSWAPMTRDARGRPAPVYRVDRSVLEQADGLSIEEFHRIRTFLISRSPHEVSGSPLASYAFAALSLFFGGWTLYHGGPVDSVLVFFAIGAVVALIGLTHRLPRADRETVVEALLSERRCASCVYDLSTISPEPDGCRVCPECGAAWKLPP
jgi:hypothetical protein